MARSLSDCAESFQASIREIAKEHNMKPAAVYILWQFYSKECVCMDQSPVLCEFVNWYFRPDLA